MSIFKIIDLRRTNECDIQKGSRNRNDFSAYSRPSPRDKYVNMHVADFSWCNFRLAVSCDDIAQGIFPSFFVNISFQSMATYAIALLRERPLRCLNLLAAEFVFLQLETTILT